MINRPKMAPHSDAPPGIETDGNGDLIPFDQRTEEDKEKVMENTGAKLHPGTASTFESEGARQERAQGGEPHIPSARDPNIR